MSSRPAHHTDDGFQNAEPISHGGPSVTIPFFVRRAAGMLRTRPGAPARVPVDTGLLAENALHSSPTVTWVGHATLLVQMDHQTFLTDPIWSDTASPISFLGPRRFVPPPVAIEVLPRIDFVLISHSHYDHLDVPTLRALAARGTRVLVPLRLGRLLTDAGIGSVEELDWWEERTLGDVTVHCVPARHWSRRTAFDGNRTLWAGWVVRGPTRAFYFAGDTGFTRDFRAIGARLGPFHLAAVPIGAYEPAAMMRDVHLNPEEAVQAGMDVGAERMLGMHWGTFDLTDEPLDEPPRRFQAEGARLGLDGERLWTLAIGETRLW